MTNPVSSQNTCLMPGSCSNLSFISSSPMTIAWVNLASISTDAYRSWTVQGSHLLSKEEVKERAYGDNRFHFALESLSHNYYLNSYFLKLYGESLTRRFPFFKLIPSCLSKNELDIDNQMPTLEKAQSRGRKILAFPVTTNGFIVNHVMIILVDLERARIEFYDSKGLRAADRTEKLTCKQGMRLTDLIGEIAKRYFPTGCSYIENTFKHQNDGFNCGVYVADYCWRRCFGQTAEEIFDEGKSFEEASRSIRLRMIDELSQDARAQLKR